jgi:hypothetical protein
MSLRRRLEQIDELLRVSGIEKNFVEQALEVRCAQGTPTARQQEKYQARSRWALRCNLLRTLLQEDYRGFSCALAGNPRCQGFTASTLWIKCRCPPKVSCSASPISNAECHILTFDSAEKP